MIVTILIATIIILILIALFIKFVNWQNECDRKIYQFEEEE